MITLEAWKHGAIAKTIFVACLRVTIATTLFALSFILNPTIREILTSKI